MNNKTIIIPQGSRLYALQDQKESSDISRSACINLVPRERGCTCIRLVTRSRVPPRLSTAALFSGLRPCGTFWRCALPFNVKDHDSSTKHPMTWETASFTLSQLRRSLRGCAARARDPKREPARNVWFLQK